MEATYRDPMAPSDSRLSPFDGAKRRVRWANASNLGLLRGVHGVLAIHGGIWLGLMDESDIGGSTNIVATAT